MHRYVETYKVWDRDVPMLQGPHDLRRPSSQTRSLRWTARGVGSVRTKRGTSEVRRSVSVNRDPRADRVVFHSLHAPRVSNLRKWEPWYVHVAVSGAPGDSCP